MTTQAPALPSQDQAFATIFDRVHSEAFFSKLASYNIVPTSEQEAIQYLQLAQQLRADGHTVKMAQDRQASQAASSLPGRILARLQPQPDLSHLATKQAAYQLAQDPEIHNAALALLIEHHKAVNAAA